MVPRLLLTLGDVAGIGPEVVVRAWNDLLPWCRPLVIGDPGWLQRAADLVDSHARIVPADRENPVEAAKDCIPCLQGSMQNLAEVEPARVDARAGRAAFDYLCTAIDLVRDQGADGIVTLPLHKEGLHAAGLNYPGHTEILADRTGTRDFGMMLYLPGEGGGNGLGVVHVTLHMALRNVFSHLTTDAVLEKIRLLDRSLAPLCDQAPRLALAALNPHAGDGGLFGDEEARLLAPAVAQARTAGVQVEGPLPADTLFVRAFRGECDGVVALYHDQGHIPLKLLGGLRAVNVTLGLPLVRTSVAHGTAYDIAWQGKADPLSLVEAVRVAARLCRRKN